MKDKKGCPYQHNDCIANTIDCHDGQCVGYLKPKEVNSCDTCKDKGYCYSYDHCTKNEFCDWQPKEVKQENKLDIREKNCCSIRQQTIKEINGIVKEIYRSIEHSVNIKDIKEAYLVSNTKILKGISKLDKESSK